MIERPGPWSQTFTGKRWFPLAPQPSDVCIEDIAHALSMLCRFGGHTTRFYSVAQHSHWVSLYVPEQLALHGLLHDAAEAYVGDMVDPLKRAMRTRTVNFDLLEQDAAFMIARKFGLRKLTLEEFNEVKHADLVALVTERRDLLLGTNHAWQDYVEAIAPDDEEISPWSPAAAESVFLDRFHELTAGSRR